MLFSACLIFSGFAVIPCLTVCSIGSAGVLASQLPVIHLLGYVAAAAGPRSMVLAGRVRVRDARR